MSSVAHPAERTVAAFDFDGTLTHHDTLLPFLVQVCGRLSVLRALVAAAPLLLGAAAGRVSRQQAKEGLLRSTLRGWWLEELQPLADEYAARLVPRLREDRLARLRWHQASGHEVVVVSASPALYIAPVAALLGCNGVIATGLELDARGRMTGRLLGDNVRGPVKAQLLSRHLAPHARLWAYGDSAGDAEMLALADVATLLERRHVLARVPGSR